MFPLFSTPHRRLALLLAWPLAAAAGCSRPIVVPVAPTGYSVIVQGDRVSGAFPDALRELGARMGCSFEFPVRPRARLSYMFLESGEADLLLPASRSAARDQVADYVPMMKLKMALISIRQRQVQAASVSDLLAQPQLRGAAVRSYVFGDEYNAMMAQLEAQHRMSYTAAPVMVARMMRAGRADFTVVAPAIFLSALSEDPGMEHFADAVTITPLAGLPPADSGVYLSRRTLNAQDRAVLLQLLHQAARGPLWKWYQHYYPPSMSAYAVRPH
ncbi:MAG: substrate-binding periplasmic protein [Sphingomonadaceae bacterium]